MIVDTIHCRPSSCAKSDTFVWLSNNSLLFIQIGFVAARKCLPQRISGSVSSTVVCMAHPRYPHWWWVLWVPGTHCGGCEERRGPRLRKAKNEAASPSNPSNHFLSVKHSSTGGWFARCVCRPSFNPTTCKLHLNDTDAHTHAPERHSDGFRCRQ